MQRRMQRQCKDECNNNAMTIQIPNIAKTPNTSPHCQIFYMPDDIILINAKTNAKTMQRRMQRQCKDNAKTMQRQGKDKATAIQRQLKNNTKTMQTHVMDDLGRCAKTKTKKCICWPIV